MNDGNGNKRMAPGRRIKGNAGPMARSPRHAGILSIGLWALCLLVMGGCMVGPNYTRPSTPMPAGWAGPAPAGTPSKMTEDAAALAQWWTRFKDPTLIELEDAAVKANPDILLAAARIRQARAVRGIATGGLGPGAEATGAYQSSQSSAWAAGTGVSPSTTNQFKAGFDAAWELDFFGGLRRGVEAADADLAAAVENRRDVLVSLTAEVAADYIDLRTLQQRIAIAEKNRASQVRTAELTRRRFQSGFVSNLDVANADALVATTTAQIPVLESLARQAIYRISVLIGRPPAALVPQLSATAAIPEAPPDVPVGVPSELLRRRPDIRQAEAEIHAATARIGVATADLFPKVTLSGAVGYQAGDLGNLLDANNRFWSVGPSVSWRIFDTGRTKAAIAQEEALKDQSLIAYRKTVLAALREVENALIASDREAAHRRALVDAVNANRKAVDLSFRLYKAGQTDFLNVLQAQRALYNAEDALAQSTQNVSTDLVALYKALGGGWEGTRSR